MKKIKLHLGCGKRYFGPDWTHIDGGNHKHLHSHDITKLPFEKDSVDLVYASHVLEYFDLEEAGEVIKEWRRVLIPDGVLRLAVPNFEVMARLYNDEYHSLYKLLGPLYGKMAMGDQTIYHKTVYDLGSLSSLLVENHFWEIHEYKWEDKDHSHIDDHSQAYLPHMDKENGTLISLNVECRKGPETSGVWTS
jgi:SAM-dependent methyltransferase